MLKALHNMSSFGSVAYVLSSVPFLKEQRQHLPLFDREMLSLMQSAYFQSYFGLALYVFLAFALCGLLATLAYVFSLSTAQDAEKRSEYECGFAPFDSATRLPFDVHFYLVGILFLVFDVEVALLFPWVLGLNIVGWFGFYIIVFFVLTLTVGFLYEWKRGALIWPSRRRAAVSSQQYGSSTRNTPSFLVLLSFADYDVSFFFLPETLLFTSIIITLTLVALDLSSRFKQCVAEEAINSFHAAMPFIAALYVLQLIRELSSVDTIFGGYFFSNGYVIFFKLFVFLSSWFVLYSSHLYVKYDNGKILEYPFFLCLSLLFLLLLISANNLISAFLCVVGFSLNIYVLILFDATKQISREAGIKYFYLSTISTGFILYGVFLLYAVTGTGEFCEFDAVISLFTGVAATTLTHFGTIFIFIGFFFKLSAFPSHLWAADVYEGAPAPVTAFFMLPVKVAVLAFFMRFIVSSILQVASHWVTLLSIACCGSLIWGCIAAYQARSMRRFLAFASINQIGFLLMGVLSYSYEGYLATVTYLVLYGFINLIFLTIFILARRQDSYGLLYITDFRGLGEQGIKIGWSIVSTLFSMAGIPPLAGFLGKFLLLLHAMETHMYAVVGLGLITSLISTYYYLRFIKVIFFEINAYETPTTLWLTESHARIIEFSETVLWNAIDFFDDVVLLGSALAFSLFSTTSSTVLFPINCVLVSWQGSSYIIDHGYNFN